MNVLYAYKLIFIYLNIIYIIIKDKNIRILFNFKATRNYLKSDITKELSL